MRYVKCPKCKSYNVSKDQSNEGYVCNECSEKFLEYQPKGLEKFLEESKDMFEYVIQYFKGIDKSNYQQKLLNTKMILGYIGIVIVLALITCFYNAGKGITVKEEWLKRKADYQITVDAYQAAAEKLPKLQKEVESNSDLLAEAKEFEANKSNKLEEIQDLDKQILDLSVDKRALERDISDLSAEKERLTKEIAAAKGKGYTLTAGVYVGGEDIPVGTYNINWISGLGNVFVGRQVNEIFGTSTYAIKSYKNCNVTYGDEIEIKGNVKVQFKAKD